MFTVPKPCRVLACSSPDYGLSPPRLRPLLRGFQGRSAHERPTTRRARGRFSYDRVIRVAINLEGAVARAIAVIALGLRTAQVLQSGGAGRANLKSGDTHFQFTRSRADACV